MISRPSAGERGGRPSKPKSRVSVVSATRARGQRSVFCVWLLTSNRRGWELIAGSRMRFQTRRSSRSASSWATLYLGRNLSNCGCVQASTSVLLMICTTDWLSREDEGATPVNRGESSASNEVFAFCNLHRKKCPGPIPISQSRTKSVAHGLRLRTSAGTLCSMH